MGVKENAEYRAQRVIAAPAFINPKKLSSTQVTLINKKLRVVHRLSNKLRLNVERKCVKDLVAVTQSEVARIFLRMQTNGAIDRLASDAARMYIALRIASKDNDADVRRKIKESLKRDAVTQQRILYEIREAARQINADFSGVLDIMRVSYGLWYESASIPIKAAVDNLATAITTTIDIAKSTDLGSVKGGITTEDMLAVDIVYDALPELKGTIESRVNKITLPGFDDAMFDTVRETINDKLYARVGGGLGAEKLARAIGKDLVQAHSGALPSETRDRLMLWARTEGCVVQNDALMKIGSSVGMNAKVWQSVGDARVRDGSGGVGNHVANNGDGVIALDKKFSDGSIDAGSGSVSPFNCFLPDTRIDARVGLATRCLYSGEAVTIKTANGRVFSVTANHPVLTSEGWVAAHALVDGSYVFCDSRYIADRIMRRNDNVDNNPARADKIFLSLLSTASMRCWQINNILAMDFYGDGHSVNSNIDVVTTDSFLRCSRNAALVQRLQDISFIDTDMGDMFFTPECAGLHDSARISSATSCSDSVSDLCSSTRIPVSNAFPFLLFSFGFCTQDYFVAAQECGYSAARNIEDASNMRYGFSANIHRNNLASTEHSGSASAQLDVMLDKQTAHSSAAASIALANAIQATPGIVELDYVISVKRFNYVGHVYDFQTDSGVVLADGIITSNCRCTCGPAMLETGKENLKDQFAALDTLPSLSQIFNPVTGVQTPVSALPKKPRAKRKPKVATEQAATRDIAKEISEKVDRKATVEEIKAVIGNASKAELDALWKSQVGLDPVVAARTRTAALQRAKELGVDVSEYIGSAAQKALPKEFNTATSLDFTEGTKKIDKEFNNLGELLQKRGMSRDDAEYAVRAVDQYMASGYIDINSLLRHGTRDKYAGFPVEEYLARMRSALDVLKTDVDYVAWRGIKGASGSALHNNADALVGMVIEDKGFSSVSLLRRTAENFAHSQNVNESVIIKTVVKKGTGYIPGVYLEQEMIIKPGAKFRILSATRSSNGVLELTAELLD